MTKMKLERFGFLERVFISLEIVLSFVCLQIGQTHGLDLCEYNLNFFVDKNC